MQLQDLFKGYEGCHGVYKLKNSKDERGKQKGVAMTRRGAPTEDSWKGHITGKRDGLGIVPLLNDNENVYFAAIDIDQYPLDYDALERETQKLPLVMTKSKSGGAHLWVFFSEPVSAKLVIEKMGEWAAALGYGRSEIFPKQWKRLTDKDLGNWINLPYYGDTRRCYLEGKEIPIEEFLTYAESKRITGDTLRRITLFGKDDKAEELMSPFANDGPPCLHVRHCQGHAEGGRNSILYNIAVYFKKKDNNDKDSQTWRNDVIKYNQDFVTPPLPTSEIHNSIFKTLTNGNPTYQCNQTILKEVCNRKLCLSRQFGISDGKQEDNIGIILQNLVKIDTVPPTYVITADGVLVEIPKGRSITSQANFADLIFETVNKQIRPVKPSVWFEVVNELLAKMQIVTPPPEASSRGMFYVYLWDFIERRTVDEKDGIAMGNVWIDEEGYANYKSRSLHEYLNHEGFRELGHREVWGLIRAIKGRSHRTEIKGKTHMVHQVPVDELSRQTKGYDLPSFDTFGE